MMNIKNAIKNYLEKYGMELAAMGAMMTGDVDAAIAMQELNRR